MVRGQVEAESANAVHKCKAARCKASSRMSPGTVPGCLCGMRLVYLLSSLA